MDHPRPVASEDRKRRVENLTRHLREIACLLDRQIDLVHALEEAQIGPKPPVDALALGAGAQHRDPKSQVARQFLEKANFFGGEGVGLGRIDVESPEYGRIFILER